MNDITTRWTSRKFWAMVVWEAVMVFLLWFGKLPVDAFVSLTWLLLGGYFVSNVAQKVFAPSPADEVAKVTGNGQ